LRAKKVAAHPSDKSLQRARLTLLKRRCAPIEVAAAITPRSFCRFMFALFPKRLAHVLADGRR
jgi:hypothetical protein